MFSSNKYNELKNYCNEIITKMFHSSKTSKAMANCQDVTTADCD